MCLHEALMNELICLFRVEKNSRRCQVEEDLDNVTALFAYLWLSPVLFSGEACFRRLNGCD